MTAQKLYELTKPLFEKHPSAKTEELCQPKYDIDGWAWKNHPLSNCRVGMSDSAAALVIQGHLIEWLTTGRTCEITTMGNEACVAVYGAGRHYSPTLLEALIDACMEVECSL